MMETAMKNSMLDDLIDAPYKKTHTNGWFANIRHHFVVAVLPPMGVEHRYESEHDEAANLIRLQQYQITTSQPVQDKGRGGFWNIYWAKATRRAHKSKRWLRGFSRLWKTVFFSCQAHVLGAQQKPLIFGKLGACNHICDTHD